jgi:hypothetical protein
MCRRPTALCLLASLGAIIALSLSSTASAYTLGEGVAAIGPEEIVFDWSTMACEPGDIPDNAVSAFRDASGRVQLHGSHFENRRMGIGPDLNNVRHECDVVLRSNTNPDPAAFDDKQWISSTYTLDGETIYALLHNEYQGWRHGQCPAPLVYTQCWSNSLTLATSTDGGNSYSHARPPEHLVASVPYQYAPGANDAYGVFSSSNIIHRAADDHYYVMAKVEAHGAQKEGACLLRTKDLSDPKSWRAWDGNGFNVRFINPYIEPAANPRDHVCEPVAYDQINKMSHSITYNSYFDAYLLVGTGATTDPNTGEGIWGGYYSLSDDLIHWGPRRLLIHTEVPWTYDCGPDPPILLTAILDPDSPTRNFETSDQRPYLYFTRFHYEFNQLGCYQGLNRDLVRIPIEFSNASSGGPTAAFTVSRDPAPTGEPVRFDASSSVDWDGAIKSYRWDLNGDGTLETDGGASPTLERSYPSPGRVTVRLRVTDNSGESTDTTKMLRIVDCRREGKKACRERGCAPKAAKCVRKGR